jgi:DNA polymerase V
MYAIIDCNNFYVSCERVFRPDLLNKPVVVLSNNDGCIISRSNEAKKLGIKMGEPYFKALKVIEDNHICVFSSNYALYGDMSGRVMQVIEQFAPNIEIYSIDEAFIKLDNMSALQAHNLAVLLKDNIKKWTGIPVSIGIGKSKTLAKLANVYAKKSNNENIFILENEKEENKALKNIKVGKIWGIGRNLVKSLNYNNIQTAYDLKIADDHWLRKHHNIMLLKTAYELRGIACIISKNESSSKKSITVSRSFARPINDLEILYNALSIFTSRASEKLRKEKVCTKFILVYIRNSKWDKNYHLGSVTITLDYYTDYTPHILQAAKAALQKIYNKNYSYTKLGVIFTDLVPKKLEKQDFFDKRDLIKTTNLMQTIDKINAKIGTNTIFYAANNYDSKQLTKKNLTSPAYTTKWNDILVVKN